MKLEGILETALYCPDLEAAENFYSRVLRLDRCFREPGRHVFFRCGQGMLLLFNPDTTSTEPTYVNGRNVPLHGARGQGHLAFRVPAGELLAWRDHIERHGVAIEAEIAWPEGGQSVYFRDPAGNSIELATPEVWGLE